MRVVCTTLMHGGTSSKNSTLSGTVTWLVMLLTVSLKYGYGCHFVSHNLNIFAFFSVPTKGPTQPCKFFPRCTNTSCPFLHPKVSSVILYFVLAILMRSTCACLTSDLLLTMKNFELNFSVFWFQMCRFGAYCTKQNCLFAHEDKTSSKMKWVSTQQ